jgi:hypothetical protein
MWAISELFVSCNKLTLRSYPQEVLIELFGVDLSKYSFWLFLGTPPMYTLHFFVANYLCIHCMEFHCMISAHKVVMRHSFPYLLAHFSI